MQSCPHCLAELHLPAPPPAPGATVRCRHCDRAWPARMQSCPDYLAELHPDQERAADALAAALVAGRRLPRPAGLPPFRHGPACTLLRLSARGTLVLAGPDGTLEATVRSPGNRAVPPLTCHDLDGPLLFRLTVYEAATRALVAVAAGGAPLATFLAGPVIEPAVDVRDGTSAPVGRVRPAGGEGGWEVVETGGGRLASLSSADVEADGTVDDQWTLHDVRPRLPLDPLGAVALVVAAKVLLGRPAPAPLRPEGRVRFGEEEGPDPWWAR
jgi:hypothetical protein